LAGNLLIYAIFLMAVLVTVYKWKRPISNIAEVFVSVIVPVRNEEQNIQKTLQSILGNRYPNDLFEVLVIDDHSDDHTVDLVRSVGSGLIRIINLDTDKQGKKQAIAKGVELARGELILCTDGDTLVPPD